MRSFRFYSQFVPGPTIPWNIYPEPSVFGYYFQPEEFFRIEVERASERSLFTDALRFKDERGASLLSQLESLHGCWVRSTLGRTNALRVMGKFSAFHKNPSCGRGMEFLLLNVEIVKRDISYTTRNGILRCPKRNRTPLSLSSFALVLFLP